VQERSLDFDLDLIVSDPTLPSNQNCSETREINVSNKRLTLRVDCFVVTLSSIAEKKWDAG
jgi:hypothetical protein